MKRVPITVSGAEKLRQELHTLKKVERPKIIRELADARSHGDLRENAEYHAARERQGFIEGRIAEIEDKLSSAQIIDPRTLKAHGRVVFGATVELVNLATTEERRYQIVGELEADLSAGQISITSPIARALIGREEGDVVTVRAPGGDTSYEIVGVEYV
ncbi:MAG: transcription elongation factor GreA [Gammaproteobacteria bacterium]|nr:transcription elongation factor GreA [Gammaproteobacteria bacterium]NIR82820.1 transcription elongation factor GreA [Gammaproteobacteria bacterium]NIR89929.1 transcription elongation factor GreA [Gammaproteobacteria bacterium]NIU03978.1 transcription elongation factor GreA [Gammaproteobacteria bacterium]NIV51298.1 transcription elongation factor GreA [Gammaproteobacteria bacterium]